MSTFKAALPTPFVVFGVATVAFVAWLAYDAAHAPAATRRGGEPVAPADSLAGPLEARLGTLSPGQSRLSVEEQLTGLTLPQVDPIDVSSGKPVCREQYMVHLSHPVPNLTPGRPEEFSP